MLRKTLHSVMAMRPTLEAVEPALLENFLDWKNRDTWQSAEVNGGKGPYMTYVKEISDLPAEAVQFVEKGLENRGIAFRWHIRADKEASGKSRTFLAVAAPHRDKMTKLFESERLNVSSFSKPAHLHEDEMELITPGVNPAFQEWSAEVDPLQGRSERFDWRDRSAWQERKIKESARETTSFMKDITCFSKENLRRLEANLAYADVRATLQMLPVKEEASGQTVKRMFLSVSGPKAYDKMTAIFQERAKEKTHFMTQGRNER